MEDYLSSFKYSYEFNLDESPDSSQIISQLVSKAEKTRVAGEHQVDVPVFIFRREMSPLQAMVKYLRENKAMKFSKIASLISRDHRTVWAEYDAVRNKSRFSAHDILSETTFISSTILRERNLSVLESIATDFKRRGKRNSEIAELLHKSPKTIWTVLSRASAKGSRRKKRK